MNFSVTVNNLIGFSISLFYYYYSCLQTVPSVLPLGDI
jgi:hypothetical protein